MNKMIFGCCMLLSLTTFSSELKISDYKKIKSMVKKSASAAMIKRGHITSALDNIDLISILVSTDILSDDDNITLNVEVMPAEENCNCQDIFNISMKAHKKANNWSVMNDTLQVEHIPTDQ